MATSDDKSGSAESAESRRQRWLEENQEAFDSANKEFERRGLLLADLIAETDWTEPRGVDEEEWINAPRAGKEIL